MNCSITCPNCELGSDECRCSNGIKIHPVSNYRPLPDCLTIKNSEIEGLGLFAISFIHSGINLGTTHLEIEEYKLLRTPVGAFYNHSDTPNCIKVSCGNGYWLKTLKDIEAGEEITVSYTLYNI